MILWITRLCHTLAASLLFQSVAVALNGLCGTHLCQAVAETHSRRILGATAALAGESVLLVRIRLKSLVGHWIGLCMDQRGYRTVLFAVRRERLRTIVPVDRLLRNTLAFFASGREMILTVVLVTSIRSKAGGSRFRTCNVRWLGPLDDGKIDAVILVVIMPRKA